MKEMIAGRFVVLRTLRLGVGDTVVTAKGTFVVLGATDNEELDLLWLETERRDLVWDADPVYGPVEVLRAT